VIFQWRDAAMTQQSVPCFVHGPDLETPVFMLAKSPAPQWMDVLILDTSLVIPIVGR